MRGPRRAALLVAVALIGSACSLQPIDLAAERPLPLRSTIVAADGSVLARLYRENRALVAIEDTAAYFSEANYTAITQIGEHVLTCRYGHAAAFYTIYKCIYAESVRMIRVNIL